MKKIFRNLMMLLCALTALVSCDESGDKIYLNGFEASGLMASASDVLLSVDNTKDIVVSFAWKNPTLLSSDETKPAASGNLLTYLQASTSEDFATTKDYTVSTLSKVFTGADLNALAKELQMTPEQNAPVYFRVKSQMGANLDAAYSNVCQVNVTPYMIHMNKLTLVEKEDKSKVVDYLYSPNEDGIYTGYMNVSSWLNFWGKENDGSVWGNSSKEGTFAIDNTETAWSCWFPEPAGIYYAVLDTKAKEWKATWLKELQLNGEAMTYDAPNYAWVKVITTSADNAPISIAATGAEYNKSTGTDDAKAVAKTMNYTLADGKMTDAETAGSVNIAKAGTYTVTVKVGENGELAYSIVAGDQTSPEPEIHNTIGMFSNDGSTLYAIFEKVSDNVYSCTYDLKNKWNMRFYYVGDGVADKQVCYGAAPTSDGQFTLYKETTTEKDKFQGWDIWLNDDVDGKEKVTITIDLNTMTWKYE